MILADTRCDGIAAPDVGAAELQTEEPPPCSSASSTASIPPPTWTRSTTPPPQVGDLWDETEDDDQFEYGYLEGRWEGGHHRKWCAVLNRDQFDQFIRHTGLTAENVQTMGSIGVPGFGFGWARPSRSTATTQTLSSRPTSRRCPRSRRPASTTGTGSGFVVLSSQSTADRSS